MATKEAIANQLSGCAVAERLDIQPEQQIEWKESVDILHQHLDEHIPLLRQALSSSAGKDVHHVILEFDFRRRGLRIDCILLGDGVLFVLEFKRSRISAAARDQVMSYAINLWEFHEATRQWCEDAGAIVAPILVLTSGRSTRPVDWPGLGGHSWPAVAAKPLECDGHMLGEALAQVLAHRRSHSALAAQHWLQSDFRPSSSIVDAAISLYGDHDVAAIQGHAAPKEAIDAATADIRSHIADALERGEYHVIFLSGAPGAGKTLVGLDLVMRGEYAADSVFVTGNAPLVDVLNKALATSYRSQGTKSSSVAWSGYRHSDASRVVGMASFKIVKAHQFLGSRGTAHRQMDGRVLVFDEAQRTYEQGKEVLRQKLVDHEADLVLKVQKDVFPKGGAVVVALIGHNQAINRGERGMVAWLEAADRLGWSFSISDDTLALGELGDRERWANHSRRATLKHGHLKQSMRFYRNSAIEEWADAVLGGDARRASELAVRLAEHGTSVRLTRSLSAARRWTRPLAVGDQRSGLIASGQARRLAAEGLFVDLKPPIATWMLAPSTDYRSSNALETVQNQYQIQGLELDHTIVCWDADFRRQAGRWAAYKLSGDTWQHDKLQQVAANGYRVLLTRARQNMVIFVPEGDASGDDETRLAIYYDETYDFLVASGAVPLV